MKQVDSLPEMALTVIFCVLICAAVVFVGFFEYLADRLDKLAGR